MPDRVMPSLSCHDERLCPINAFAQAKGGKYKLRILWELIDGPRRYGYLRRSPIVAAFGNPVTARVLSRELKELQARGVIHRRQVAARPLTVEYSLTDLGGSLVPLIEQIVEWGLASRFKLQWTAHAGTRSADPTVP